MLEPLTYISDVELYMYPLNAREKESDKIPEEYFDIFPPLKKYVFVNTPTCHYELLKQLLNLTFFGQQQNQQAVAAPINRDKKNKDKKLIDVLNFFVSIMPQYPPGLGEKFSDKFIETLSSKGKIALVLMLSKNPQLFPSSSEKNNPLVEAIINLSPPKIDKLDEIMINVYLNRISKEIKGDANESFALLLTQLFESNVLLDKSTSSLLSIFKNVIRNGPEKILNCRFPSVMLPLKSLQPFSLLNSSFPSNNELFASMRVYCYAFKLLGQLFTNQANNLKPSKQLSIILMIHRFLKSGYICVDAFIKAIIEYSHNFWKYVGKSKKNNKFLIAVAIANAMSCYELPFLKQFVQKFSKDLIRLFSNVLVGCTDLICKKTFTKILSALQFTSITPLSLLFQSWNSNEQLPLLPYIMSMDEHNELFVPLVVEARKEIAQSTSIYFPAEVARKLMLTGPTTAANYALKQLATAMDFTNIVNTVFANKINSNFDFPISLFVPMMHLMTLNRFKLSFANKQLETTYINLVMNCAQSESVFSLHHLEYLSGFLQNLSNNSFLFLFRQMRISNTRTFLRFLLFISNSRSFAKQITSIPTEFDAFMKNLRQSLNHPNNIYVISIAWRNMVINFNDSDLSNNLLGNLFQFGTNGLLMQLNKDSTNILIKAAICDVLQNQYIITKLTQKVKSSLRDKNFFIAALFKTNEDIARKEFPDSDFKKLSSIDIPTLPRSFWKHEGWAKIICSNIYLAPKQ